MKKIVAIIGSVALAAALLAGCAPKVECEFCGEVARCKTTKVWGEEVYICQDCAEEWDELFG